MKKKHEKFLSHMEDKFFINKLASFYGIKEKKVLRNNTIDDNLNLFNLTQSSISNRTNYYENEAYQLLTPSTRLKSIGTNYINNSRNTINLNNLTTSVILPKKKESVSSLIYRKALKN